MRLFGEYYDKLILNSDVLCDFVSTGDSQSPIRFLICRDKDDRKLHFVLWICGFPIHYWQQVEPLNEPTVRTYAHRVSRYVTNYLHPALQEAGELLLVEALEIQDDANLGAAKREWIEFIRNKARDGAKTRLQDAEGKRRRETKSRAPALRRHRRRADLIRRSLEAIAELRRRRKKDRGKSRITQKMVAPFIYNRRGIESLESVQSQYSRELRKAGVRFSKLVEVNKKWDELTLEERSDLFI